MTRIRENSIEFFDSLNAVFIRRLKGAEKYYTEILKQPFSFTKNEELSLNSDKDEYAKNEDELQERWREYIKYRTLVKYVDLQKDQDKKRENKDSVNAKFKTNEELEVQAREDHRKNTTIAFLPVIKNGRKKSVYCLYQRHYRNRRPAHQLFPSTGKSDFDVTMSGGFVGIESQIDT
jgi:carboxyl-terminal processing protease